VSALCALTLVGVLAAASSSRAAGLSELPVTASGPPLALPTISPPPPVSRAMHWSRVRPDRLSIEAGYTTGTAVVGLVAPGQAAAVVHDYGVRGLYLDRHLRTLEVRGTPERLRALAAAAGLDPRLRYVEPPRLLTLFHRRNDPAVNTIDPATGAPYEWTFGRLGVEAALNLGRGSPTILVGVIDSGVATVPDLTGKIAQTFTVDSAPANDTVGHGTFVASIIASNNDDGIGLAGFCGACRLLVYQLPRLDDFSVATGIRRLVDEHVRIINLSLGTADFPPAVADAVGYAVSHGVLVVAAAGNESSSQVSYPAALLQSENGGPSTGLAVGASDAVNATAWFSNTGTRLSMLAPGSFSADCRLGIFAAVSPTASVFDDGCVRPFALPATTSGRYAYAQGTSFSAPEVAGIAALAWAASPRLTSTDIAAVLEQTATRPADSGWTPTTGWGVVNAARALEYVTGKASADRVNVDRISPVAPARSGRLFQVIAKVAWSDALPVPSGSVRCDVAVAGRLISVKGQVAEGAALCQWRVPQLTQRRLMSGVITVSDSEGITGDGRFAFLVPKPTKS
jgi:subtilisin family serine protease